MKKRVKRIISMLITVMAMVSMLSLNAMATESTDGEGKEERYQAIDTYVWEYKGEYSEPIYTLNSTVSDGNCLSYGVDNRCDAVQGTKYQRMNLEDATYTDASGAGMIRAIILNTYPNVSLESVQEILQLPELTQEELVHATQMALYHAAHGEAFDLEESYVDPARTRIEKVYTYFMGLSAVGVKNQLISVTAFTNYSQTPVIVKREDGFYDVTVSAEVSVAMQESDNIVLSAVMTNGAYYAQKALVNGQNVVEVTIENVPKEVAYTEVSLKIDGMQSVHSDVFLFVAEGGESVSQTFAAVDDSQQPVHAEVSVIPPIELILMNTAEIRESGADGQIVNKEASLEGKVFDIYRLGDVNAAQNYGEVDWATANIADYVNGENYVTTLTTDAAGVNVCNLTAAGQTPGTFLVVEKSHPAITSPSAPVMVTLPYATDNGNVYRKELSFENTIKSEVYVAPQVRKDVTQVENDKDSFDAQGKPTWIIRGDIPVDIAVGKEYVITDTLDYRLSYAGDEDVVVKVGLRSGGVGTEAVTLTRDVDYTLISTPGETTVGDGGSVEPITSFQIRLTDAGRKVVAGAVANGVFSDYEVRVYFNAYIDEDASAGEMIPNQAILEYINYVNYYFYTFSDVPMVHTCGIMVYMHDAANENVPLSGAEFRLARLATQAEIDAGLSNPLVINGETANVVYVSFHTKSEITQEEYWAEKALSVTSDAAGFAILYGIADGDYYLIETKAHAGYNLPSEPIQISVNDQTPYLVKYVANSSDLEFPLTGGIGTTIFIVGGAILIGAAILILVLNNKKEDSEEDEE